MKNILMIVCDQLRQDCLGCYGNSVIQTPHLDALAAQSVQCTQSYVANPICMPNRLSMFSGMYPRNHGLWTNGLLIKDEGCTLPHHLVQSGYQTACIGKVHFEPTGCDANAGSKEAEALWAGNPAMDDFHGPHWGFQYLELMNRHSGLGGHYRKWFYDNGGQDWMLKPREQGGEKNMGATPLPPSLHASSFIGQRTAAYLEKQLNPEKPFFLVASFPDPHSPFNAPQAYYDRVRERAQVYKQPIGTSDDLATRPLHYTQKLDGAWSRSGAHPPQHPGGVCDATVQERILHTYAMIELIDHNVGLILQALERQGLLEDTIVVFTSDHGELLGDHGLWLKGPFFYDGLLRTPLLFRLPAIAPQRYPGLFSTVDITPTLCGLTGLKAPYYCDGLSHAANFLGEESSCVRESCLVEYRNGYGRNDRNSKALVTPQWKFVLYQDGEMELTNRLADEEERVNLADDPACRPVLTQMKEQLLLMLLQTESKKPEQLSWA